MAGWAVRQLVLGLGSPGPVALLDLLGQRTACPVGLLQGLHDDAPGRVVKGDAIAGIIITIINIGAGFVIGVLQKDMPIAEAAQNYTILTVGDGLVGQIQQSQISTSQIEDDLVFCNHRWSDYRRIKLPWTNE